jgi:hypothetical protein
MGDVDEKLTTYSLGFFLGPGFPRGFGTGSAGRLLLEPGLGPGMPPFFLDESGEVADPGAVGVAVSEPGSADEAGSGGEAETEADDDGDSLIFSSAFASTSSSSSSTTGEGTPGHRRRTSEDSFSTMVLVRLFDRPAVEEDDDDDEAVVAADCFAAGMAFVSFVGPHAGRGWKTTAG